MVRPKQVSDADLLKAAREAFLRNGPKTAVTEVAERLGVSAAALFQRVGSKAQLMLLSLLPGVPGALTAFAQKPGRDTPVSIQLEQHLVELMAFLKSVVPSMIVLRAAKLFPPPTTRAGARGVGQAGRPNVPAPIALRKALAAWLLVARTDGRIDVKDPEICAEALLGAMEARCFNAHVGGDDYVRGSDAEFLTRLIAGLLSDHELPEVGKGLRQGRARRERKDS